MSCSGMNSGPAKLVSDVPIVAAQRVIFEANNVFTSYDEMLGLPDSQLDTIYWMPWYNNASLLTAELILGVGDGTQPPTATPTTTDSHFHGDQHTDDYVYANVDRYSNTYIHTNLYTHTHPSGSTDD